MERQPRSINRVVYARVALLRGVNRKYAEDNFQALGWGFQEDGISYTLVVPVYSARSVAIEVAKSRLSEFSRSVVPLVVDELRLVDRISDNRKFISAFRRKGGWIDLLGSRIGSAQDVNIQAVHWQVAVAQSASHEVEDRRWEEESEARLVMGDSQLPGEPFSDDSMKLSGRAEPKKRSAEKNYSWTTVRQVALIMPILLASIAGASLAMLDDLPVLVRVLTGLVASVFAGIFGWWQSGDRLNIWVRVVAVGGALLVAWLMGFLIFCAVFKTGTRDSNFNTLLALPIFLALIALLIGCVHLIQIHPQMKRLASIPFLTAAIASVVAVSQLVIFTLTADLELPAESVAVSPLIRVALAVFLTVTFCGVLILFGGLFGWAEYFDLLGGGLVKRALVYITSGFLAILIMGTSFLVVFDVSHSTVLTWKQDLQENRSPKAASDFIYRACLVPRGSKDNASEVPRGPLILIQGKGGELWSWELGEEDELGMARPLFLTDGTDVRRLQNGDVSCK